MSGLSPQQHVAAVAFIVKKTRVSGHRLQLLVPTGGTRNGGFKDHRALDFDDSDLTAMTRSAIYARRQGEGDFTGAGYLQAPSLRRGTF